MSDPRFTDPRLSDPVLRHDEAVGGAWGWIAGLAVVALIGFLIIAGSNGNNDTANNNSSPNSSPMTTGSTPRNVSPPSTTGLGTMSPRPLAPAPDKPGTQ